MTTFIRSVVLLAASLHLAGCMSVRKISDGPDLRELCNNHPAVVYDLQYFKNRFSHQARSGSPGVIVLATEYELNDDIFTGFRTIEKEHWTLELSPTDIDGYGRGKKFLKVTRFSETGRTESIEKTLHDGPKYGF